MPNKSIFTNKTSFRKLHLYGLNLLPSNYFHQSLQSLEYQDSLIQAFFVLILVHIPVLKSTHLTSYIVNLVDGKEDQLVYTERARSPCSLQGALHSAANRTRQKNVIKNMWYDNYNMRDSLSRICY